MSLNASFVQVEEIELSRIKADPSLAEPLFEGDALVPPAFIALTKTMQDRVRTAGPKLLADALTRFDPAMRKQLEERLGKPASVFAAGAGGDDILKLMQQRRPSGAGPAPASGSRAILSLDKAWHGVHYVLCGEVEPTAALLSKPVLGGVELGDDDEGFSGYGPVRYFTVAQVTELSQALSRPGLEPKAAARFDAARMSELSIYPGWRPSDAEWVMDGFRRLRDFYFEAAGKRRAIITCLV